MAQVYAAEITGYGPGLIGERVFCFASQGFVTKATDTPAHTYYDGRIQQPANVQRSVFGGGRTSGSSTIGYGELVLVNNDGGLDELIDYGFDGRPIVIKLGTVTPACSMVPTWTTVLVGTMEQAEFAWTKVTIRVRDRQQEIAKALQTNKYAGSNTLPAGLEGVAGDLAGKPKPKLYGTCFNIAPPCVNTAKLAYQVSDGPIQALPAVYVGGVAQTAAADYATSALMLAAAPAALTYITCVAEGYFRLGSAPTGQVTCDAVQGATAGDRTVAQIIQRMLLDGGIAAGDIESGDVAALDVANSAEVGYWASAESEVTVIAAADEVANSIGAWYGVDRLGKFRMGMIAAPTGPAVVTLTSLELLKIDRVASADEGKGVPAYRVNLGYRRHWTTQDGDLAGAVTAARRAELREEYRRVTAADATVQTVHLLAPELRFDTLLIDAAAAGSEAERRLDLYSLRRDRLEARVAVNATLAETIDLGAVVCVQVERFGYDLGKNFLVIGVRTNLRGRMLDLTLWG